jgi:DegV family protein with EDD domain
LKTVGIITDSHSGIPQKEAKELGIFVLSMPFYFEEECFYEDVSITREEFFNRLRNGQKVSTSQPSPEAVMQIWNQALEQYDEVVYIPISSGLSGSCQTAMALAMEEEYEGRVFVVDNGRVSTPMHRSVLDAVELVKEGYSAKEVKEILEEARAQMVIYIAVESLEYLKRGGRVSATTAALGSLLNIKPVLKFDVGILDTYKKCRGFKKAKLSMIEAMQHDLETKFAEEYARGEVYLVAASSADEETTKEWIEEIKEAFPNMDVMCDDLSLGVSCHIGPGGLGIGCSCKPKKL